jgi:hypothetical protein
MNAKGVYYGLVEAQNLRMNGDDQKELEDEEISSMMSYSNIRKTLIIYFRKQYFRSSEIIKYSSIIWK